MARLHFHHPEPPAVRPSILPVFLPFMGCPGRCLYCDQQAQTGGASRRLKDVYNTLEQTLEDRSDRGAPPIEVGFYGGTFTSLPAEFAARFVALAAGFKAKNVVSRIRCSTRPDCLAPDHLIRLRELGLDIVELGVQSFSDGVLRSSGRAYSGKTAAKACHLVHELELGLVVQLLPGLPGHTTRKWKLDIEQTIAQVPQGVRIYPCLVIAGTELAGHWEAGEFVPWNLKTTIELLAWGVERLWSASIPILRMGLPPEPGLLDRVVAGPWHPALGNQVRALVLFATVAANCRSLGGAVAALRYPRRYSGEIWGHEAALKGDYRAMGIEPSLAAPWDNDFFLLQTVDASS